MHASIVNDINRTYQILTDRYLKALFQLGLGRYKWKPLNNRVQIMDISTYRLVMMFSGAVVSVCRSGRVKGNLDLKKCQEHV